jgi:sulfur-carrier protein
MATVNFTYALKRFYPNLKEMDLSAENVNELLSLIEKEYSGIKSYIVDDQGRLRQHVNIFVNGKMIADRIKLSDTLETETEVYIMQALSGG